MTLIQNKPKPIPPRYEDEDGDALVAGEQYTAREILFCKCYTAIGTEEYSHGTKSATTAKYAQPEKAASKLMKKEKIRKRIAALLDKHMKENFITPSKVLCDLENQRIRAEKKGDITNAIAASKLQGSYLTMFSERYVLETDLQPELSAAHLLEARKIAALVTQYHEQLPDADGVRPSLLLENKTPEMIVEFSEEESIEQQFSKGLTL